MLKLLSLFAFYLAAAFGAVVASFLLPGWWWGMMAALIVFMIVLGAAQGLGCAWAKRLSRVLFWPR